MSGRARFQPWFRERPPLVPAPSWLYDQAGGGLLPPRCPHPKPADRAFSGCVYMVRARSFCVWGVMLSACSIGCLRELCRCHLDSEGMEQAQRMWPDLGDVRPISEDIHTFEARLRVGMGEKP